MKTLAILLSIFLFSTSALAANSVIDFTDRPPSPWNTSMYIQTSSPNPLLTQLIADNLSHTLTLSTTAQSSTQPIIHFSLSFNGTGTGCIVRMMDTSAKGLHPGYPVAAGTTFGRGIHLNTKFVNYSGCYN